LAGASLLARRFLFRLVLLPLVIESYLLVIKCPQSLLIRGRVASNTNAALTGIFGRASRRYEIERKEAQQQSID
jgi:hypothetical protein